jgi:hypothetical protein
LSAALRKALERFLQDNMAMGFTMLDLQQNFANPLT